MDMLPVSSRIPLYSCLTPAKKKKIATCKTAEKSGNRSEQQMAEREIEVLCLGSKHRGNDRKEMVLWVSEKRQEANQRLAQSLRERE